MKVHRIGLALALAFGMAGLAQANPVAMLYKVHGKVMVNQGEKFVEAKEGMALNAGDRIMAMEGASASLEYGNACTIQVAPNSSITVTPECHPPVVADVQQGAAAAGSGTNYTPLVIGGVALLAVAVAASGGGSSSSAPISP